VSSSNLTPDIDLAARLFDELRDKSFDGVGITREAYGPGEAMAHGLMAREGEALGLEVATDFAGNLYLTLPGVDRTAPRVVIGSHLDSVPQGGNFDGAAGVLAGMATVSGMRRAGFSPARDITVVAVRAEEAGAWFPTSYPGSRAALGRLKPEELAVKRQDNGRSLEDHMREAGFHPEAVRAGTCVMGPETVAAFVELHIEQGPVLEADGLPVGIVTGIPGSRRHRRARITGEYSHSGAVPRKYRADAAIAMAELAYRLDAYWGELDREGHRLVCTFCEMATGAQAGFTKIAGEVNFSLDVRAVAREPLDLIFAEQHRLKAEIELSRGVAIDLGAETQSQAAPMHPAVIDGLRGAAERLKIPTKIMASGGGHDAAAFAQAGVPAGMVFVRNQNGSHNPHEAMRMDDFAAGAAVVAQFAASYAT
jgi:N-carbamoyl-L-amino-acid hydrolase